MILLAARHEDGAQRCEDDAQRCGDGASHQYEGVEKINCIAFSIRSEAVMWQKLYNFADYEKNRFVFGCLDGLVVGSNANDGGGAEHIA